MADETNKRTIASGASVGMAAAQDMGWNDQAGAHKVMGPNLGVLTPVGDASTSLPRLPGSTMVFFNADNSIHYVKFGGSTVTAPTGPADGIPVPPGTLLTLGFGDNTNVISDTNDVYAYDVADATTRKKSL